MSRYAQVESALKSRLNKNLIKSIVQGNHGSPCDVLGMHEQHSSNPGSVVVRTFQPYAEKVEVLNRSSGDTHAMRKVHDDGLFEVEVPGSATFAYRLRMTGHDNHVRELDDPYSFPLQVSDFDLYLHGEGSHYRTYLKMGAHPMTINGIEGVHFAVWAPNAIRVSVIGWFNRWDGRHTPLQSRGESGLWEIFIPELKPGDLYKFEIKGPNGYLARKSDPYAFAAELRPRTASMVWDNDAYHWADESWMKHRRETDWLKQPISTYEVHLGSWRRNPDKENRWLTYRELAEELIPYVKELGFTHIELLPITEHPFDGSWGYQAMSYFAPTSRFGTPDDLKFFIDRCHQEGMGVILDWVPAHFPKDGHGLAYFDGTHLYEHADPRRGEQMDWGTLIFNYGRNEVKSFLLSSAMYWTDVYHMDGIRVDAVASMLYLDYSREAGEWAPNEYGGRENLEAVAFLKQFNEVVHDEYPGFLSFAEESTSWPMVSRPTYLGGLGFGLKWNMGWMNDTLGYISKEPVHRKFHHNELTFSLVYAFTENFILPFSHDEVVHGKGSMLGKMPGDVCQKFANLRTLYAYMWAYPGKKLLFMGAEFGQWEEWNCYESLQWDLTQWESHHKLQDLIRDLNRVYRAYPCMHVHDFSWDGFEWIDFHDSEQSTISFVRKGNDERDVLVCVFNLTPVPREGYRLGLPLSGEYDEVLNTDAWMYGGSNMGNSGRAVADDIPWQGKNYSALVTLPPLGGVFFRPSPTSAIR